MNGVVKKWEVGMNRYFRFLLLIICLLQLFFAAAYIAQLPFATALWPLPNTTPMSFIFMASIFAAAAASTGWCVLAGEHAGLAGVAVDYVAIFGPLAVFGFQEVSGGNATLLPFSLVSLAAALFGLGLLLWSVRIPFRDTRPMPRLVRGSFFIFVLALLLAGGSLILRTPNILPWRVSPEMSIFAGWIFVGAATYFGYGLLRPVWGNAVGQLAGFLAYDVVLILPFLQRLPTISPEFQTSLILYLIVVVYSGLLAVYYLFVNPATRLWRARRTAAGTAT
jgi:hypothetical protein